MLVVYNQIGNPMRTCAISKTLDLWSIRVFDVCARNYSYRSEHSTIKSWTVRQLPSILDDELFSKRSTKNCERSFDLCVKEVMLEDEPKLVADRSTYVLTAVTMLVQRA